LVAKDMGAKLEGVRYTIEILDGQRIEDSRLEISAGQTHVYQVGKRRFARVSIK